MAMDYREKSKALMRFKKSAMGKKPGAVMALRRRRLPMNVQGKSFMYGAGVIPNEGKMVFPS
jgi:hypothetical protein